MRTRSSNALLLAPSLAGPLVHSLVKPLAETPAARSLALAPVPYSERQSPTRLILARMGRQCAAIARLMAVSTSLNATNDITEDGTDHHLPVLIARPDTGSPMAALLNSDD